MPQQQFLDAALRLAEEKGWSRAELARRAGFSNSQFNKWSEGVKVPASSVIAVARALEIDVVTALIEAEAVTADEVGRHASAQTLADLDLVDLARATYERARKERELVAVGDPAAGSGGLLRTEEGEHRRYAERRARQQGQPATSPTVGGGH